MNQKPLPREFADLGALADEWSMSSEQDRHRRRIAVNLDSVRTFYNAMFPRMDEIITFLNRFSLADIESGKAPGEVANLHNLALAFMEVSHPIDMNWRSTDIDDAFPTNRLEFLIPSNTR